MLLASMVANISHSADLSPERKQALSHLLKHDCGSCHGMRMTGGLGPALTEEALRNKSDELLRHTILNGRPGTPMPPFATLLSIQEVDWLIHDLRNGVGSD
jgi:cytochrome c55X